MLWTMVLNDEGLGNIWTTLQPTMGQRRRIDARVYELTEAHDTTLAGRVAWARSRSRRSRRSVGAVSAVAIAVATAPLLLWLARLLM